MKLPNDSVIVPSFSKYSFDSTKTFFSQTATYFLAKFVLFLLIALSRLHIFLKTKDSDLIVYFLLIIALLIFSLGSELFLLRIMVRKKIKKDVQRAIILIHQIITFQILIELTLPMSSIQEDQRQTLLREELLFLTSLMLMFFNSVIFRYGISVYIVIIFNFRLSEKLDTPLYITWAIMLAVLLVSGGIIIFGKSKKNSTSNMPEKARKEFESHTEGIALITKQRQAIFMNGNFKGLLDSTNEPDALQEVLRLRRFESYSERVRRGFMQEIRNEKGGHHQAFTRQQSLRQKSDPNNPRSLMRLRSIKKSTENDRQSAVVTFKDSNEIKTPSLLPKYLVNRSEKDMMGDGDIESRNGFTAGTTQPYTKSITKRLFSRWNSKKGAPVPEKVEFEQNMIPHGESVEAQLDAMLLEIESQETSSKSVSSSSSSALSDRRLSWWGRYFKEPELPSRNYLVTEGNETRDVKIKKSHFVYRTALGELKILKIRLIPFLKNNMIQGILINIHDVTQQIRLQEALEINEQKDKLLSFVAHEFRTPLNCTLSLLEVLKGSISFALSEQFLDPVLNSSKMLQNLVNDILDFSQIKAKKLKVTIVPCNLRKVVEEVMEILRLQATALGINFQVSWDNHIPRTFHTDPNRFKQILVNLVANAFKFTHGGSVTIKSTLIDVGTARIEVIDTGIGISKENVDKLFQEFGKVQESAHLNPTGIGLGLVISKLLSIELGPDGTGLTVESEEGVGTTFSFILSSKGGDYLKSNFMSRTIDLETSDDEDRERPDELIKKMKAEFGEIDQATKPVSYQETLVTNTQMTEESPKSSLLVHQRRGNILEMKASLVKKNTSKQKSKQFSKFASLVKSSNVIVQSNNDTSKFGTFSQGNNMPKRGGGFPSTSSGARKKTNKSFGRSHRSLASGDITYMSENNPNAEFSIFVENLNEACECPKVLIVDDNAFNLTALTLVLKNLGIETATAVNGDMAIQKVMQNQDHNERCRNYSIIFMDVEMPILNGFETTKILKKKMLEGDVSFIPIIGVTGHNAQDKKVECLRSGMNDMISKPVSTLTLQETIMKWVDLNSLNNE